MKTNKQRLQDMMARLDALSYIKPNEIPDIDLYMDQVTTFMDEHLGDTKRYPEDKILTKTMINNYAKNRLLPPPVKKKYSKDHMLMLIFIYYFKNLLSFNDIEELFRPITSEHFSSHPSKLNLEEIYNEVFAAERTHMSDLKKDLLKKFKISQETFSDVSLQGEDQEYLRLFAFVCQLSFDVYLKKQLIEMITDQLRSETPPEPKRKNKP